jgi:putative membrane protein
MLLRWLLASLHLLALGIGLMAVWTRGRGLQGLLDKEGLHRVFLADTFWGIAAGLWIATGLLRAFAGLEKGTAYYLQNHAFLLKMALLVLILLLEAWPMVTLIRWRVQLGRGKQPDTTVAPTLARISWVQTALVILMVFAQPPWRVAMACSCGERTATPGDSRLPAYFARCAASTPRA